MSDAEQLAINGGAPAVASGPFPWPAPDDDVRVALEAACRDGDWGRYAGRRCERLRSELADRFDVSHAHLVCSGTFAVELALRAVGVAAGDEVLLAAYDFPGNFRAIEAIGARPVLCDIAADAWTLDLDALESAVHEEATRGVRAVLASHLHGTLTPMRRLTELAAEQGWRVVEDACQCPGAVVDGRPAGAWGDAAVLSFGGSKLLTAGRGGAMLTNDDAIAQRAKIHTNRGNDAFPLSELQAAVLLPQLAKLDDWNQRRRSNVQRLMRSTRGAKEFVAPPDTSAKETPAYYKVAWRAHLERLRSTLDALCAAMQAEGAPIDRGFRGFASRSTRRCRQATGVDNARTAAETTVLLHHPVLLAEPGVMDELVTAIGKVLAAPSID